MWTALSEALDGLDHLGALLELDDHGLLLLDVLDEGNNAVVVDAAASVVLAGELEQTSVVGDNLLNFGGLGCAHVEHNGVTKVANFVVHDACAAKHDDLVVAEGRDGWHPPWQQDVGKDWD